MGKSRILQALLAMTGLAFAPTLAHAGSQFEMGEPSPLTASAHLDFTIQVPRFVFLQVGTGTAVASAPDAGQVTARVIGNNGTITLSSATQGAMNDGAGDTISYAEMNVAVAADNTATALAHPALVDGSGTSINLPTTSSDVTNLDAKWTFSYNNTNAVPVGTYDSVNSGNDGVTYSVSMP